jgi:hypothetical protein
VSFKAWWGRTVISPPASRAIKFAQYGSPRRKSRVPSTGLSRRGKPRGCDAGSQRRQRDRLPQLGIRRPSTQRPLAFRRNATIRTPARGRRRARSREAWPLDSFRPDCLGHAVPSVSDGRSCHSRAVSRCLRTHPTAGPSSGPSSARSSRCLKSAACIIATSAGRPEPAHKFAAPGCPSLTPYLELRLFPWWPGWGPKQLTVLPPLSRVSWRSLACRESTNRCQPSGMRFW